MYVFVYAYLCTWSSWACFCLFSSSSDPGPGRMDGTHWTVPSSPTQSSKQALEKEAFVSPVPSGFLSR